MNLKTTLFLSFLSLSAFAQTESIPAESILTKKQKGNFYATWGYTRCWYSKSDIHFKDRSNNYHEVTGRYNDYDFTIYDAKAKDRPDYDQIKDVANITIPQFVLHIGYYFNNKRDFGVEFNYDHAKYVVTNYQTVHIKGSFNGQYVDKDTIIDPDNFLHFEHTDGANFFMLNFLKRWKLYEPSKRFNIGYVIKPGAGIVVPRTDVTMFGERLNNKFHVAGWIAGLETGFRVEFLRHGVFEFTGKGVYADYRNSLVLGKGNGQASHHFFATQLTMTLGLMF
ncbi:MAG: hypothetical protein K0S53_572 [Bacteroidetes bacterium]|jgi:hypothetical protein|nr:hypothetical protein [Bacteroidota bacterium]